MEGGIFRVGQVMLAHNLQGPSNQTRKHDKSQADGDRWANHLSIGPSEKDSGFQKEAG